MRVKFLGRMMVKFGNKTSRVHLMLLDRMLKMAKMVTFMLHILYHNKIYTQNGFQQARQSQGAKALVLISHDLQGKRTRPFSHSSELHSEAKAPGLQCHLAMGNIVKAWWPLRGLRRERLASPTCPCHQIERQCLCPANQEWFMRTVVASNVNQEQIGQPEGQKPGPFLLSILQVKEIAHDFEAFGHSVMSWRRLEMESEAGWQCLTQSSQIV